MNLDITGRHFAITAALRQAVGDRLLQLLERESLKITSGKAVLSVEKGLCSAEVLVSFKNHKAAASAAGYDMYQVIDEAVAKIDRQMGRVLDKLQAHRARPLREITAPLEPMPVPEPTGLVVKNGSKIRLRVASSIPAPLSWTDTKR